jgi:hypothetical protein
VIAVNSAVVMGGIKEDPIFFTVSVLRVVSAHSSGHRVEKSKSDTTYRIRVTSDGSNVTPDCGVNSVLVIGGFQCRSIKKQ